jgi:flagellar operon protein
MINRVVTTPSVPINNTEQVQMSPKDLEALRQNSFIQILQDKMTPDEVSFSAHALTRLEQRNIAVDERIKMQLEDAIEKIALKGGRESLIMLDDVAYLVSIPNKKVITALETNDQNVFTNIDSAMLMQG